MAMAILFCYTGWMRCREEPVDVVVVVVVALNEYVSHGSEADLRLYPKRSKSRAYTRLMSATVWLERFRTDNVRLNSDGLITSSEYRTGRLYACIETTVADEHDDKLRTQP